MTFTQQLWRIILQEFTLLRHKPLPVLTAFAFPLIAWLLIALALRNSAIHNIPVFAVDHDNSNVSRLLIRSLDATEALRVVGVGDSDDAARDALVSEQAAIVVVIPGSLKENIARGRSSQIQVFTNGSQLLYSRIAYRAVATTAFTISAGIQIKRMQARGMTPAQAQARALPVRTEIHAVGNAWYDYAYYLAPGMMMAILQMSACFSALWFFREHKDRDAALIAPIAGQRIVFFIGRLLPLAFANVLAVLALFLIVFPLAGVRAGPAYPGLFMRTILFVFVCMGMGAMLSGLFRNLVSAAQIGLLINAPAFVFSGYTFPRWAMPDGIRFFAELLPLTHLLDGFFPLLLFNRSTITGLPQLVLFLTVFWGASVLLVSGPGNRLRQREAQLVQYFTSRKAASNRQRTFRNDS